MKYRICTLLLLFFVAQLAAQDPHFSRYNGTPTLLNPALTGIIPSNAMRLGASVRSQWQGVLESDAYVTKAFSFDSRICIPQSDDFFGLGFNAVYDGSGWAGTSPMLSRTNFLLSGAFVKHLSGAPGVGRHWQAALGAEAGLLQYRMDEGSLNFFSEFDGEGFGDGPDEVLDRSSFHAWDMGAGFLVYSVDYHETVYNGENRTAPGYALGISAKHLNTPNYQFFDGSEAELKPRIALHGVISLQVAKDKAAIRIIPVFVHQQPFYHATLSVEGLLNLKYGSGRFAYLGAGFRRSGHAERGSHYDALLLNARLDLKDFSLAFGYDFNVSSLRKAASMNGAWEVTLLWHFGKSNCDCNCDCPY